MRLLRLPRRVALEVLGIGPGGGVRRPATAPAQVVGPFVVSSCDVRYLQHDAVGRAPGGYEVEELGKRPGGRKQLVDTSFRGRVVALRRQANVHARVAMMGFGPHSQGKLCEGLEAGYIFLGILGEEWPERPDLIHGIGLGELVEIQPPMPT